MGATMAITWAGTPSNAAGKQQEGKNFYKLRDTLPQSTGEIKLFTAVVNNMEVPENIDMMTPAMNPITGKV
jgi:hypothetical protein